MVSLNSYETLVLSIPAVASGGFAGRKAAQNWALPHRAAVKRPVAIARLNSERIIWHFVLDDRIIWHLALHCALIRLVE